ncbi:Pentatricopeptide repeat-containing protein [Ananas comosus]|uniref:Pentatricopeptide repeat-containing protein n=1 Tax=Ananas comosus TaxID=4615 RepID=A0A199VXD6_ANACO|nr:Pentatricopeptide repeat-containing protein [Ananas comosus]
MLEKKRHGVTYMVVVFPPPSSDRPQQPIPRRRHHHLIPLPVVPLPFLPVAALESFFFSALLRSAASLSHLRQAHALLLRLGLHHSSFLVSKLLRLLSPRHLPPLHSYPLRAFLSVPDPNPFLFTSLIRACCSSPDLLLPSLRLFSLMRRRRLPPLPFTFSALLKSAAAARSLPAGALLHSLALSLGAFPSHLFVANSLLAMYVACSDLRSARRVFDEMPLRDLISWTSLVVAYARSGDMESAAALFASSPAKDVVAWTALVTGYAHNAMPGEALDAFVRMRDAGVTIDEVALVGAVSACAQLGAVSRARWVVRDIAEANGFGTNVVVGSALVDMYAKCGLIDDARQVFDEMPERNVYTYSSMIAGLASHGRAYEAIALFREMVGATNVAPNRVTLIGVLTACSHAGMVEEGRFFFAQMKDKYRIPRSADHYACMVDLLGRAGLVEEALELVKSMPIKPHGGVWGALLGACRIHNKPEIAKTAADRLLKLEPECIGSYILLSNIYASAGMWDEVSKVRKLMRGRGLKKNPAASWVEGIDGLVHEFFAGDASHPRSREIKKLLEELMGRLKLVGYMPILSSVVYDVSDGEKERLLKGHSEKLALAFALLTRGISEICEDCHLVMSCVEDDDKERLLKGQKLAFAFTLLTRELKIAKNR